MRYSVFSLLKEAFNSNKGWKPTWRDPEPQAEYDVIIVGGGAFGTARRIEVDKMRYECAARWS